MPEYDVEADRIRRRASPNLKRLRWRFRPPFWLFVLIGLAVVMLTVGTPHMLVTYEYQGSHERPVYTRCDYFGVQGWRRFFPETMKAETCPFIKFMTLAFTDAATQAATAVPKNTALNEEKIGPLYWGVIAGSCLVRPVSGCERVKRVVVSGDYNVIHCAYGPLNSDGTGFRLYSFWHDKVPDDPLGYAIKGDDHPFLVLGKMAVAKCPPPVGEAEPVFQASRLFPAVAARP